MSVGVCVGPSQRQSETEMSRELVIHVIRQVERWRKAAQDTNA
jgi:hypothetical protein